VKLEGCSVDVAEGEHGLGRKAVVSSRALTRGWKAQTIPAAKRREGRRDTEC
jgi:hypothetical protein